MATLQSRLTFGDSVLGTEVDGEAIIMHLDSGRYFTLNHVGTEIWSQLREGRSVGEVCTELAKHYDASPEKIEAEVLTLVEKMIARGLTTEQP